MSVARIFRELFLQMMKYRGVDYRQIDLKLPTIIFSPHQDDETLGCGGLILKKKQAGANVKIIFMTDGCRSHSSLIAEDSLKQIRRQEALKAAEILGVGPDDVVFLDAKDGTLMWHLEVMTQKVIDVIIKLNPQEVFIPYFKDGPRDHEATNKIVLNALSKLGFDMIIYEYPVWFWYQWPWIRFSGKPRQLLSLIVNCIRSKFGYSLFKNFRCSIDITQVSKMKRLALEQHQSQMSRLVDDPRWNTLGDLAGGEFLERFFYEREFFYQHRHSK